MRQALGSGGSNLTPLFPIVTGASAAIYGASVMGGYASIPLAIAAVIAADMGAEEFAAAIADSVGSATELLRI